MRLTCPNCGAQYEVPDEVVPPEGRDVQCSNCNDTWYQERPNTAKTSQPPGDGAVAPKPDAVRKDKSNIAPDPAPESPSEHPAPKGLDTTVSEILRQEAETEVKLRTAETRDEGVESKPNPGLDDLPDIGVPRPARVTRDRIAIKRPDVITPPASSKSSRGALPDIEEINSTLRASGEGSLQHAMAITGASKLQPQHGGFARGFGLILLVAGISFLTYVNAHKISVALPQSEPALSAYVTMVDEGRVWLDKKASELLPK